MVTPALGFHLVTATGIPYRLISSAGSSDGTVETAQEVYLMDDDHVAAFLRESFPATTVTSGVPITNTRPMPGRTRLRTVNVTWEPFIQGKPIDPFFYDNAIAPAVHNETYGDLVQVTIDYSNEVEEQDPEDPDTYLEITANAAGEYLHIATPEAKFNSATRSSDGSTIVNGTDSPNTYPTGVPATIIVTETEWTVTWKRVDRQWFDDVLISRLRNAQGAVNSSKMPLLKDAFPETILFGGFTYGDTRVDPSADEHNLSGSITGVNTSTETFTSADHSLEDTNIIVFDSSTDDMPEINGGPGKLLASKGYYIVGSTGDTFQIAETRDGTPINISSTGQNLTWTSKSRNLFVEVGMKFLEKVAYKASDAPSSVNNSNFGSIKGHNDFYDPKEGGWQRLKVDGTNPPYRAMNLSDLFVALGEEVG